MRGGGEKVSNIRTKSVLGEGGLREGRRGASKSNDDGNRSLERLEKSSGQGIWGFIFILIGKEFEGRKTNLVLNT